MKKIVLNFAVLFGWGLVVGSGIRAAEWLIPQPEQMVAVCMVNDIENKTVCRRLNEVIKNVH